MDPIDQLKDVLRRARKTAESGGGYNSNDWCEGRIEGIKLAIAELDDELDRGWPQEWQEPGVEPMDLSEYWDGEGDPDFGRYSTEAEAREGHARWVRKVFGDE